MASASNTDFEDINPTLTYHHLLNPNPGVRDPFRVIVLCDCDAFYANCELVRLGLSRDTPLVVVQWGLLIAVSYAARKFGITRLIKLPEAKKLCDTLVVVHVPTYREGDSEPGYWENINFQTHKASLDIYRRESFKIINMFRESLPTGETEKASIDEAFFDFTKPVRDLLLERYPYLAKVPKDAPLGPDTPLPPAPSINWNGLGNLVPIVPSPKDPPKAPSVNEGESSPKEELSEEEKKKRVEEEGERKRACEIMTRKAEEEHVNTWHDVALSIAAELMNKMRRDVYDKLGYSTSAGIARNKFLAKLVASYKKPFNQSLLRNSAIPNYLKPFKFQEIRFLKGKLGLAIAEEYDAVSVGDLLHITLEQMQATFGDYSIWIWELLRGIDRHEVKEKSLLNKSMLSAKNLPTPIHTTEEGHHWVRVLAAELALRLNEAKETSPTIWPKSINLHVRRGRDSSKSKQTTFPFVREVTVDNIAAVGLRLWKELVGKNAKNIGGISLSFHGLESAPSGQKSIEGFFKPGSSSSSVSLKRSREETPSWEGATPPPKSRTGTPQPRPASRNPSSSGTKLGPKAASVPPSMEASANSSFTCERCGRTLSLPEMAFDIGEKEKEEWMSLLKFEHDDFHFAEDLSKEAEDGESSGGSTSSAVQQMARAILPGGVKEEESEEGPPSKKRKFRPLKPPQPSIAKFFTRIK